MSTKILIPLCRLVIMRRLGGLIGQTPALFWTIRSYPTAPETFSFHSWNIPWRLIHFSMFYPYTFYDKNTFIMARWRTWPRPWLFETVKPPMCKSAILILHISARSDAISNCMLANCVVRFVMTLISAPFNGWSLYGQIHYPPSRLICPKLSCPPPQAELWWFRQATEP